MTKKGTPEEVITGVFEPLIDKPLYYKLQKEIHFRSKTMSPPRVYELAATDQHLKQRLSTYPT